MEPIDQWTVAGLKAELNDLGLPVSGKKQELYDRLLEIDVEDEDWSGDDDWDEEESWKPSIQVDFAAIGLAGVRTIARFRVPILTLFVAALITSAAASVLPKLFEQEEIAQPEINMWKFSTTTYNQSDVRTMFVEDDTTETVIIEVNSPKNLSSVYVGAHFSESDETNAVQLCDWVTMEVLVEDVNRSGSFEMQSTEKTTNDCNVEEDAIWYDFKLELLAESSFEGTEEEALLLWEPFLGVGEGTWVIEVSVDTSCLPPCLIPEDGEEIRLTIAIEEFVLEMQIVEPVEE